LQEFFYRNAFNIGLPILELPQTDKIDEGDILEIDTKTGKIFNKTKNQTYQATAIPEFMQELIESGGLFNYAKKMIQKGA
jgi:3-isopropylmalate/(R)-2-methylmalate dehydratase small subunit